MTAATGRVAPRDTKAELAVLGGCMLGDHIDLIGDILTPDDFYSDANGRVWKAMMALSSEGGKIDDVLLAAKLKDHNDFTQVGGWDFILTLTETIPASANVERHAARVRDMARMRRMIVAAHKIAAAGYEPCDDVGDYLNQAETQIMGVSDSVGQSHAVALFDSVDEVVEQLCDRAPGKLLGVKTGIDKLDKMTTGWNPGELIIIAGRPGMGKTAFAERNCRAVAQDMKPVLWFSMEMPRAQLISRQLSGGAKVDHHKLRAGTMFESERNQVRRAGAELKNLPIYIDDSQGVTLLTIKREARRLMRKLKLGDGEYLGMILVDYIGLMKPVDKSVSREQQVSEISAGFKGMAMEFHCPVVVLSQLNRDLEKRPIKQRRPQLSDLRESGSLEQDADTVLFIYRDELYNKKTPDVGIAELIIGKQRSGPIGTVRCAFIKEYTRFENLAEVEQGEFPPNYNEPPEHNDEDRYG